MQSFVSLPLAHGLLLALFLWSGVGNAKASFVASETSAHASAHGPHLGVVLMRSGPNVRPLVSPSQGVTLGVGVSNLRGDEDAHSVVLTVKLPSGLTLQSASPAPNKA